MFIQIYRHSFGNRRSALRSVKRRILFTDLCLSCSASACSQYNFINVRLTCNRFVCDVKKNYVELVRPFVFTLFPFRSLFDLPLTVHDWKLNWADENTDGNEAKKYPKKMSTNVQSSAKYSRIFASQRVHGRLLNFIIKSNARRKSFLSSHKRLEWC